MYFIGNNIFLRLQSSIHRNSSIYEVLDIDTKSAYMEMLGGYGQILHCDQVGTDNRTRHCGFDSDNK